MSRPDPSNHRVLLVGPRVIHLKPFFDKRGYPVVAAGKGVEGMAHLDTVSCDVVILELNLGDLTATEFLMAARQAHPRATFLLLDEATRAGQIVKALQAGLDGYLATPPDEERLFYEVERHLARAAADEQEQRGSGFEESSTQTTMTTIAEVEAMQIALAERDAQMSELHEQLGRAQQTVRTLRDDSRRHEDDARRLQEVQNVLAGHLEKSLDGDEAMRLRERLGLAQVADIELQSLRIEAEGIRAARKEADARHEETLRELKRVRAAADAPSDVRVDDDRVDALQADIAHLNLRNDELQASLTAARASLEVAVEEADEANSAYAIADAAVKEREGEVQALRAEAAAHTGALQNHRRIVDEYDERVGLLDAEIARLNVLVDKAEAAAAVASNHAAREVEGLTARVADRDGEVARLIAEVARLAAEVAGGQERLARAQAKGAEDEITRAAEIEDTIANAVDLAVERERLRVTGSRGEAIAAAVAIERTRLQAAHEKALAAAASAAEGQRVAERARLEAIRLEFEDQTRQANERALDLEFQLEESRTRAEFLEEDAARVEAEAEARVVQSEQAFKKEKLRLVEEKQAAASGSQEAVLKMDRFISENAALKRSVAELEADRESEHAVVAAAEARVVAADRAVAVAIDERDREVARAAAAVEALERAEAAMGGLQAHARDLETAVETARVAADVAAERAATLEARIVAAEDAKDTAVSASLAASAHLAEVQTRLENLQGELRGADDRAIAAEVRIAAVEGDTTSTLRHQALRIVELEVELTSKSSQLNEVSGQLVEISEQLGRVAGDRAAQQSEHEAAIALLQHELQTQGASASRAAADVQHALVAVRAEARDEFDRLSTEANVAQTHAAHVITELQRRLAQVEAARGAIELELPGLRNERERLLALVTRLESETMSMRDQLALTASSSSGSTSNAEAALATVRSLLEGVDPLRWGLGAAIDYLNPFEGNDQSLASHVRNLRLLQATLARLSSESGKSSPTG